MTSWTLFLGGGAISVARIAMVVHTGIGWHGPSLTRESDLVQSDHPVWKLGRRPLSWGLDLGGGFQGVTIPLVYPFVILLLAAPLLDRSGRRRRTREREGLCQHCGYQLGSSTARCPECGRLR